MVLFHSVQSVPGKESGPSKAGRDGSWRADEGVTRWKRKSQIVRKNRSHQG